MKFFTINHYPGIKFVADICESESTASFFIFSLLQNLQFSHCIIRIIFLIICAKKKKKKKGAKVSAKIARLIISLYKLRLIMIVKLAVERGISLWWFSNSNSFHGPSLGPDLWDWVHLALASVLPMSWLLFHRLSRVSAAVPKGPVRRKWCNHKDM